jgi:hypothetical protein
MSDDLSGFAPPPFDAAAALLQLKRQLRDLRLAERGTRFEIKGRSVLELSAPTPTHIEARIAKRPASVPAWTVHTLNNPTDVRSFVDTLKRQLARWTADE